MAEASHETTQKSSFYQKPSRTKRNSLEPIRTVDVTIREKQRKERKSRNKQKAMTIPSKSVPSSNKQAVAVKEIRMNQTDFGELIFGGNVLKNLNIEANLNNSVKKLKLKKTRNSKFFGTSARDLQNQALLQEQTVMPRPLRKHLPRVEDKPPVTSLFTKVMPKNATLLVN